MNIESLKHKCAKMPNGIFSDQTIESDDEGKTWFLEGTTLGECNYNNVSWMEEVFYCPYCGKELK